MNAIEAGLAALERKYEEGLLLWIEFCDAVVESLSEKCSDDYRLHIAFTPRAILRIVEAMNIMRSASISGEPVLSVGSSATTYDHTAKIASYLALAEVWQSAGWIELGEVATGVEGWKVVDQAPNN